jgi:hypothetical protein
MDKKEKNHNQSVIDKVNKWQNFKYVHALVCRKEGCGEKLVPEERYGKVVLRCPTCGLIQNYIPKSILEAQVDIPVKLLKNQRRTGPFNSNK